MIVVADAGPIRYLVAIGRIELLRRFYGSVVLPHRVLDELSQETTPETVRRWVAERPGWILVVSPKVLIDTDDLLDPGETHALSLVLELGPDALLLVDDLDARRFARDRNITITGTLGVLLRAHVEGMDDIRTSIALLAGTNYRSTPALLREVIQTAEAQRPT